MPSATQHKTTRLISRLFDFTLSQDMAKPATVLVSKFCHLCPLCALHYCVTDDLLYTQIMISVQDLLIAETLFTYFFAIRLPVLYAKCFNYVAGIYPTKNSHPNYCATPPFNSVERHLGTIVVTKCII